MKQRKLSRREAIKGSAALGFALFASPLKAAAPEPVAVTPQLIDAAKREGKVVLYSAMDLPVGEKLGNAFQAQFPGVEVQVRSSVASDPCGRPLRRAGPRLSQLVPGSLVQKSNQGKRKQQRVERER